MAIFANEIKLAILHIFGWLLPVTLLVWSYIVLDSYELNPFMSMRKFIASIPLGGRVIFCVLLAGFIVYGSTKSGGNTNSPSTRMKSGRWRMGNGVTTEDIARGWRVVTSAEAEGLVEMPSEAVTNDLLRRRGGYDWAFRVEPEGWHFPYRDGVLEGVTVFARGEVRPDVGTLYFPTPITNGVSLLPEARWNLLPDGEASAFRHAVTTNISLLLDWRNALVGRDANALTNLQMELFSDGSFTWRTDGESQVYLPVFPFDWDGDGLENSVDPEPLIPNAVDAHGTNGEWYNIVCSNVFVMVESSDIQTFFNSNIGFRPDVNTNAYYFIDVVTEVGPAPIYFNADRDSRLGSPVVVGRAGETNHVPLLIGLAYTVTSTVPITVSLQKNGFAEIIDSGDQFCTLKWPLNFEFVEGSTGINMVTVEPYDPGGTFSWNRTHSNGRAILHSESLSSFCGCWSGYGPWVSFNCLETCGCAGDCRATGEYSFEDAVFSVTGGVCRCGFDDPHHEDGPTYEPTDGPYFSIDFSKSAVIFEDAYDDGPGVHKAKRSTRVRLTVSAYGGPNGGTFILAPQNLDKLVEVAEGPIDLPSSRTLAAGEIFYSTCIYEGEVPSGSSGDVRVAGVFVENGTGVRISPNADLTVVRVSFEAQYQARDNLLPSRHSFGICERVKCVASPVLQGFQWQLSDSAYLDSESAQTYCICPATKCENFMKARLGTVEYLPRLSVLEPDYVECSACGFLPASMGKGIGMALRLHLSPYHVSFEGVQIQEVPALAGHESGWGTHTGYFNDIGFATRWYHYSTWGAGVWHNVGEENQIADHDESRMFEWPQPWSEGSMSWRIPIAWRDKTRTDEAGRLSSDEWSTWTMSDSAIVKRKYEIDLVLTDGGVAFLDGERQ